jgi:hypothetical protein
MVGIGGKEVAGSAYKDGSTAGQTAPSRSGSSNIDAGALSAGGQIRKLESGTSSPIRKLVVNKKAMTAERRGGLVT